MVGHAEILSEDLSAATDSFTRWAILAAWEGFCDGAGLGPHDDLRVAGKALLGPRELHYTGVHKEVLVTKRGALMGSPLAWPVLNLLNLW